MTTKATKPATAIVKTEVLPPAPALSPEKLAMVKDFSKKISDNLAAAAGGLNNAALLLREASLNGCGEAVMEDLRSNSPFSKATLDCLQTTVNRVIPFIEQQGGDPRKVGSLDGMRELLPKVASLDKASGQFKLAEGAADVVKRALAGESPRKLVNEIKTGTPAAGGGGGASSLPFKAGRLADSLKDTKAGKHDAKAFVRHAGRGAARGGMTLEDAIAALSEGFNKESEAILARAQKAEADAIKKAEAEKAKKDAAKAKADAKKAKAEPKKAEKKAAKAPKLGAPKPAK